MGRPHRARRDDQAPERAHALGNRRCGRHAEPLRHIVADDHHLHVVNDGGDDPRPRLPDRLQGGQRSDRSNNACPARTASIEMVLDVPNACRSTATPCALVDAIGYHRERHADGAGRRRRPNSHGGRRAPRGLHMALHHPARDDRG